MLSKKNFLVSFNYYRRAIWTQKQNDLEQISSPKASDEKK